MAGWKALLRVDPPRYVGGPIQVFDEPLELSTLGEPKVSQARFYSASNQFEPEGVGDKKGPGLGFTSESRLRGRKVYLPHVQYLDDEAYWNPSRAKQKPVVYERWGEARQKLDTNVRDAVAIGSAFTTTLRFEHLTEVELGALVWLLSLPDNAVFGLGLGKPSGFGSVSLAPKWAEASINTAGREGEQYRRFGTESGGGHDLEATVRRCFNAFEKNLDPHVREEFLDAVCGFQANDPAPIVHYPMTAQQYQAWQRRGHHEEQGLFLWWSINDQDRPDSPHESLPPLGGEDPPALTRHLERPSRGQWSGGQRPGGARRPGGYRG